MSEHLEHYGTPRHSGRYPWGSGKNPQRSKNFLQRANELEKQIGATATARAFGLSTTDYRAKKSLAKAEKRQDDIRKCVRLRETGMSLDAIAKETKLPPSTVRSYLDPSKEYKSDRTTNVANNLKKLLSEKPYLDVGEGVNRQLNISEEQLKTALSMLQQQGYSVHTIPLQQVTNPTQNVTVRVLSKEGTTRKEVFDNRDKIVSPDGLYFEDYGDKAVLRKPVRSVDSKRVEIRYAEQGGLDKDGVIELRPGVEDISLGGKRYMQVRIAVDDSHYLKGMAVYSNDLPDGVDIRFNTNKHEGTPKMDVLKKMNVDDDGKVDQRNPFGANFTQLTFKDANGEKHVSAINKVNDDEDWDKWKKSLSSQWLSKQPIQLAKRQLELDYEGRENELNDILSIPNPTVKRQLLETFASEADSAAVHLKGAALPRQGTHVILPVTSLRDNEVYAPNYENGEEVVLVRFPHAGRFEMPRLKVNNNNPEAIETIGRNPAHAIGINSHVANILSGADFDGDTVLVIPTKGQKIMNREPLEGLKDFNHLDLYKKDPSLPKTGSKGEGFLKGKEMGSVSNLITDMTIKGADWDEIERAVKHSMVVIDAEKHNLDWRQSAIDNGIAELKTKYQGGPRAGGSTLISQRKATADDLPERKPIYSKKEMEERGVYEDWLAGKNVYKETGRTYIDEKGNVVKAKVRRGSAYQILEVDDVHKMTHGYLVEDVYADYANDCKRLAERARAELRKTGLLQRSPDAARQYKEEVDSLNRKLDIAARNAPFERQAQAVAGKNVASMCQTDPSLKDKENKDRLKKVRQQQLAAARDRVGAKRNPIDISPKEWEAIQAGAISDTKLQQILRYTDIGKVRQMATPRTQKGMSSSAKSLARQLLRAGYPQSVVAERCGVSVTTLSKEFDNFNGLEVGS